MIAALLAIVPLLAAAVPTPTSAPLAERDGGSYIQSGRDGLCLSVQGGPGASLNNGVPVVSVACNQATTWDINPGSGSVLVHGSTQFALDAGSNPGNNGALKIWQSYPGLYQQTWFLTGDNRIAITGGNQCLDEGTNGIQTYQCTTGNTNQVFYVQSTPNGPSGPSTSPSGPTTTPNPPSSGGPTTTYNGGACTPTATYGATGCVPSGPVYQDPSTGGKRLHPNGRPDLCVTVQNGFVGIGTNVAITGCFANGDDFIAEQLWDLPASGSSGAVRLHGSNNLCLDAGDSPANGSGLKIWTCYDGLLQQTWNWNSGAGTLALGNGQCLDVVAGSAGNYPQKPYGSVESLQTWQCSTNGDPQQKFFTLS